MSAKYIQTYSSVFVISDMKYVAVPSRQIKIMFNVASTVWFHPEAYAIPRSPLKTPCVHVDMHVST